MDSASWRIRSLWSGAVAIRSISASSCSSVAGPCGRGDCGRRRFEDSPDRDQLKGEPFLHQLDCRSDALEEQLRAEACHEGAIASANIRTRAVTSARTASRTVLRDAPTSVASSASGGRRIPGGVTRRDHLPQPFDGCLGQGAATASPESGDWSEITHRFRPVRTRHPMYEADTVLVCSDGVKPNGGIHPTNQVEGTP